MSVRKRDSAPARTTQQLLLASVLLLLALIITIASCATTSAEEAQHRRSFSNASSSIQWWLTTLDHSQLFKRQHDIAVTTININNNKLNNNFKNVFHVYDSKRLQPIYGFGGALTQSSAYLLTNLKRVNSTLYSKTMKQMFGTNSDQSAMTAAMAVLRVPISACDFTLPTVPYYTYDDVADDVGFEHFSLQNDMNYIIPILKDILAINPKIKIIASPWSAPVCFVTWFVCQPLFFFSLQLSFFLFFNKRFG